MNDKARLSCHKISEGKAKGEALISKDPICFYLVEPETGNVMERNHSIEGKSVAGKVLIFPSGKGSSVVQADGLYQLVMNKKAPKAMIIKEADTVLVATAIIMEIPLVDKVEQEFYDIVSDGAQIEVDADNEKLVINTYDLI